MTNDTKPELPHALPKKKPAVFHHPHGVELWDGPSMDLHAMKYAEPLFQEIERLTAALTQARAVPRQPLTKDQIDFILGDSFLAANGSVYSTRVYDFVRAIEAAHHIGTTQSVGRAYTQADLWEAVKAERYACSIAVWMTLQDALEPDADDKGLEGWMREAEARVKNRLAHHGPAPSDVLCWLVEEFGPEGNSTGRYMLDQGALTITYDVYAARRFRRWQSAGLRALDMKAQHKGDWRAVAHGFDAQGVNP